MENKEFLRRVLPPQGVYLVAVKGKGFRHYGLKSIAEMAEFIAEHDSDGDVYHACAAYKNMPTEESARKSDNWLAAKSFWVDIDCGEDKAAKGKGYATKKEAVAALSAFCKKCGFPEPMVVSSGYGLHCYWTLTESLTPDRWIPYAGRLKTLLNQEGILQDPSRTSDFASILRPVGSTNKKHEPYKMVKCLFEGSDNNTTEFLALLDKLVPEDPLANKPAWLTDSDYAGDMFVSPKLEYNADAIAERCAQVRQVRDSKGDASYETWRRVIGILTFCEDGETLAADWTANRAKAGHTQVDWRNKFDTWDSPPPLCEGFRGECPKLCEGCPYADKIKTPLVLGGELAEQPPIEVVENATETTTHFTPPMPPGYQWNSKTIVAQVVDKNGVSNWIPFCPTLFYPIGRICNDEDRFLIPMRMHLPDKTTRDFDLPAGCIGQGGSTLMKELADHEVYASNIKGAESLMTGYLKAQAEQMKRNVEVTRAFTTFGWHDNGRSFLIGDRLYEPGGKVTKVILRGPAQARRDMYPEPTGSLDKYANALNSVYDRAGMEPMQYAIASLWGAPLSALVDPMYKGIPCALTGASSGKGKTTAFTAALYAFGDGSAGKTTVTSKTGSTPLARMALLGAVANLPVLFDEFTNISPKEMSDMAYSLANGSDKIRLQVKRNMGVDFAETTTWNTQTGLTGNANLIACLAEKGQSEAEAMRVFEIRVDEYSIPKLNPADVAAKLEIMQKNMGCAGEEYIRFIVDNSDIVEELLKETDNQVSQDEDIANEPKYRFYRYHMICSITAAKIMHRIGVCNFNIDKLLNFAHSQVINLCTEVKTTHDLEPEEILSQYIAEHLGGTLITTRKIVSESQIPPPRDTITARAIRGGLPKGSNSDGWNNRYITSANEFSSWCNNNRIDVKTLLTKLETKRILIKQQAVYNLAMGTSLPPVRGRSHLFDLSSLDIDLEDSNTQNTGAQE